MAEEFKSNPEMGFMRRHSDAITALAILLGMAIASIGSFTTLEHFVFGPLSILLGYPDPALATSKEISLFIVASLITLGLMFWLLKIKERSLWFLLIFIIPLGWALFIFVQDHGSNYYFGFKYWKGRRQLLCWLGIIALAALVVISRNWNVPIDKPVRVFAGSEPMWIMVKNYANAPAIIRLCGEYFYFVMVLFVLLFYGSFNGGITTSPRFRRDGAFLVRV